MRKIKAIIIAGGFLVSSEIAISQQTVYDPAVRAAVDRQTSTIQEGNSLINSNLDTLLGRVATLIEKADEQLERMGSLEEVNEMTGEDAVRNSLLEGLVNDPLLSNEDFNYRNQAPDATAVFRNDLSGLRDAIGEEYTVERTDEDGNVTEETVERDESLYLEEAAFMQRINQYKNVRDKAIERRKQLKLALAEGLEVIKGVTDQAALAKQQTILDLLQHEIAEADREIEIAATDLQVYQTEVDSYRRIAEIARQEELDTGRSRGTREEIRARWEAIKAEGIGTTTAGPGRSGLTWPPTPRGN